MQSPSIKEQRKRTIIVSPLHWGLGHASRSVPLIQLLLDLNCRVILASDGAALELLRSYFPQLEYLELPSYSFRQSYREAIWNAVGNASRVWRAIRREHGVLRAFCDDRRIDGIISDHRLGIQLDGIPSILIAHQLHIPLQPAFLGALATRIQRYYIHRFDEVWIPDEPGRRLSGALSDPGGVLIPHRFIGLLSALNKTSVDRSFRCLAVLSGPEPARSDFEEVLIRCLGELNGRHVLVLGKPDQSVDRNHNDNIEIIPFTTGEELSQLIAGADHIICRPGYSGLMDLIKFGKSAVLVPTPGQPEQRYLARQAIRQWNGFVVREQRQLNLRSAIDELDRSRERSFDSGVNQEMRPVLENWLLNC